MLTALNCSPDDDLVEIHIDDVELAQRSAATAKRGFEIGSLAFIMSPRWVSTNQVLAYTRPYLVAQSVWLDTTSITPDGVWRYLSGIVLYIDHTDPTEDFILVLLTKGNLMWFHLLNNVKSLAQFQVLAEGSQ